MSAAVRLAVVLSLLIAPDAARAHPAFAGADGFAGGLLHPFFVPAHAMAIIVTGLLIARQTRRWRLRLAFVAGLTAGFVVIAGAYVPTLADVVLLVLTLVAGALVASAKPLPPLFVGAIVLVIGGVIALDSPPEAMIVRTAIETQLGTFCGAAIFLYAVSETASRLRHHWQLVGARILGSWIAASAILVLALQFAK